MAKQLSFLAVGLVLGALAAFAFEHFLGEGAQLAQTKADLATANASLTQKEADFAKLKQDTRVLKDETDSESAQIQELTTKNAGLEDKLKSAPVAGPAPSVANPFMAGMMKAGMAQQQQEKLLLYKTRLNLTPEQEAIIKTAMENEAARAEQMLAKMSSGGKIDPQALAAAAQGGKSVDQTLKDILTPDQLATYKQMQDDQKKSTQESMAMMQMNQIAPLLQLSEPQKDQVYSALYQVQETMQDPAWIKANATNPADPTAIMGAQAKAKEDALAKILTPDQLATYHQQAQSQLQMQKAMIQKFMPGGVPGTATSSAAP